MKKYYLKIQNVFSRASLLKYFQKLLFGIKLLFGTFLLGNLFFVFLYRIVDVPFTPLMIIRYFDQLFDGREIVFEKEWVDIEQLPTSVIYAVMAGEDNKFVSHFGFDFQSIYLALEKNLKNKSISAGGSTISQQTAKNVFLWPSRSFVRKGLEIYPTLLIELLWPKERILEVYLNVVEFGDGIYGIEAASQKYFKKSSSKLTTAQAALLSAILPNPRYYEDHLRDYKLKKRKNNIINSIRRVKRNDDNKNFVKQLDN